MLQNELHLVIGRAAFELPTVDSSDEMTGYCVLHGMSVTQIATHGWLVSHDPRVGNFGGLIGCVEECDRGFELMEIGGGFHWSTFATFRESLIYMAEKAEASEARPVNA